MFGTSKNLQREIDDLRDQVRILSAENENLKGNVDWLMEVLNQNILGYVIAQGTPPRILYANKGISLISGYSIMEILNAESHVLENLIHPEDRKMFLERYFARLKGDTVPLMYEMRLISRDGTIKWLQIMADNISFKGQPSVLASFVDITVRKAVEDALRQSEEQHRLLFHQSPVGIFYYDRDFIITHCNDRFVEMLKSTREKLTNFDLKSIVDRRIERCIQAPLSGEEGLYEGPYISTTSGATIIMSMKTETRYDEQGEIAGGAGIIEDITARKAAEDALIESEKRFRELMEKSPLAMVVFDNNGDIIFRNRRVIDLFGYTEDEIPTIEICWQKVFPDEEQRETVKRGVAVALEKAVKDGKEVKPHEWKVTCKNGYVRDVEFRILPVGIYRFVIMNDVTRQRKTEDEILKAKKIESVGILAGGIAHDFNNILTAIVGNISLAKHNVDGNDRAMEILTMAERASFRAKDLTQQLLTFSRGGAPVKKATSIEGLLRDTVSFVLSGSNIKSEFVIDADLRNADIDEGQISQVIHNLVLNARQSMLNEGIVRIEAENFYNDGDTIPLIKGNYLRIAIKDQGMGINEHILPNIFDPFFTTREKGSGLGLSVTYSIVKRHGGYIDVESQAGKETVFTVYLPATSSMAEMTVSEERNTNNGGGRILVMDDDAMVLDVCRKMLRHLSYRVSTAVSGDEAIEKYRSALESGEPFDCVIMDLTIPGGMGGEKAIQKLKELDPRVRAIVSSGYSNDPVMSKYLDYGFLGVATKPFRLEDLESVISRVLGMTVNS
ncbi:MAG: hypothetical protein CVV44_13785 [Spirochaetae bacterium HGW-Spirochaetae-1]|jgi:PAS domain S-box-containing protein|nr:MAG: hypothetical protein CVV44_13785 [Spirochaetae bacterium HGW-Spirochaetae-1]